MEGRQKKIRVPVVVVIGGGHAESVCLYVTEACFGRNIRKRPIAEIAIKLQRFDRLVGNTRPPPAAHQQDILPAIAVVVKKRPAGPYYLGHPFLAEPPIPVPVFPKTRLLGDLRESKRSRRRTGRCIFSSRTPGSKSRATRDHSDAGAAHDTMHHPTRPTNRAPGYTYGYSDQNHFAQHFMDAAG